MAELAVDFRARGVVGRLVQTQGAVLVCPAGGQGHTRRAEAMRALRT